jgi:hypothetical protein
MTQRKGKEEEEKEEELSVRLSSAVIRSLKRSAEQRGIEVSDFIRLGLIGLSRKSKYMDVDTIFSFGKYYGETLGIVVKVDPSYVYWCMKNLEGFILSTEAEGLLLEIMHQERLEIDPEYFRSTSDEDPR